MAANHFWKKRTMTRDEFDACTTYIYDNNYIHTLYIRKKWTSVCIQYYMIVIIVQLGVSAEAD